MKTTRNMTNDIKMLEAGLAMSEQNSKGSQGAEKARYNEEQDGIRAALKRLGA